MSEDNQGQSSSTNPQDDLDPDEIVTSSHEEFEDDETDSKVNFAAKKIVRLSSAKGNNK